MPGRLTHYTTNHDTIREWAEARDGQPAAVKRTRGGRGKNDPGIIRIDFPGYSGEGSLEPLSWDEFFEKFDDGDLVFIYQEETARGQQSNFNKFVRPENVRDADEDQIERSDGRRSGGRRSQRERTSVNRRGSDSGARARSRGATGGSSPRSRRGSSSRSSGSRSSGSRSASSPRSGRNSEVRSVSRGRSGSRSGSRSRGSSRSR
jgi:hypothetical protein